MLEQLVEMARIHFGNERMLNNVIITVSIIGYLRPCGP